MWVSTPLDGLQCEWDTLWGCWLGGIRDRVGVVVGGAHLGVAVCEGVAVSLVTGWVVYFCSGAAWLARMEEC